MKSIAIITLYDDMNYGNKLQNYAIVKYFEQLNYKVSTIRYQEQTREIFNLYDLLRVIIHKVLSVTQYEKQRRKIICNKTKRRICIGEFSQEYLHPSEYIKFSKLPKDLKLQYDYFIVGSDQVWHGWKNDRRELKYFFLIFADPAQRLTIAPSFGFEEFPKKYIKTFKKGLDGFEYLSVREEHGAELIKELIGKEALVLLDPTMLIDISEWLKILRKPSQYIDDQYILVYALGGFKGDVREKTNKLAENLDLRVIDIMDINSDYYIHTRPDEFLYWIQNARLVMTDSFHACVFSILFKKPFVCFKRTDHTEMCSRFETLFNKFGIKGRYFEDLKDGFENNSEVRKKLFSVDCSGVQMILDSERKLAEEFYNKCLHRN